MSVRCARIHQQETKPNLSDGSDTRKSKWVKQQFRWIKRQSIAIGFPFYNFITAVSFFFNSMVEDI